MAGGRDSCAVSGELNEVIPDLFRGISELLAVNGVGPAGVSAVGRFQPNTESVVRWGGGLVFRCTTCSIARLVLSAELTFFPQVWGGASARCGHCRTGVGSGTRQYLATARVSLYSHCVCVTSCCRQVPCASAPSSLPSHRADKE